jgi:hypothetical protein
MHRLKMVGLAAIGTTALLGVPSGPAVAGCPLLFAPWALGHLLRAVTVPLMIAATAASASASYGYDEPGYSARPNYYGQSYGPGYAGPPVYYAPPAYYRPSYYGAPPAYYGYARPYVRYYGPRGYDAAPRVRYSGPHGAQGWHGGGGYYRRW